MPPANKRTKDAESNFPLVFPSLPYVNLELNRLMADFGESGLASKRAIKSPRLHGRLANYRLLLSSHLFTKVGHEASDFGLITSPIVVSGVFAPDRRHSKWYEP